MLAVLKFDGKVEDVIDLLMTSVMTGKRQSRHDFSRVVGI